MSIQKKEWIKKEITFNSQEDLRNYFIDSLNKVKKIKFNLTSILPLR